MKEPSIATTFVLNQSRKTAAPLELTLRIKEPSKSDVVPFEDSIYQLWLPRNWNSI
jgi:hypothetical protein